MSEKDVPTKEEIARMWRETPYEELDYHDQWLLDIQSSCNSGIFPDEGEACST